MAGQERCNTNETGRGTYSLAPSSSERNSDSLVSILEGRYNRLDAFQLIIPKLQLLSSIISRAPGRYSWATEDVPRGDADRPPWAKYC